MNKERALHSALSALCLLGVLVILSMTAPLLAHASHAVQFNVGAGSTNPARLGSIMADGVIKHHLDYGYYATGQRVAITANAPAGYAFNYWQYGTGVDIDCPTLYCQSTVMTVQASGNFWIAAYFYSAPPSSTYTIAVNTSPSGLDSPSGGGSAFHLNDWTTIRINSVTGYAFQYWTRDGFLYTYSMSFSYRVDASHTFTAVFRAVHRQYAIVVNTNPPGLDSPHGGGTYSSGTIVTIGVGSVSGYVFLKWQKDGADFRTQQYFQYTVDASHVFTAVFQRQGPPPSAHTVQFWIASNPAREGSITAGGTVMHHLDKGSYSAGQRVAITANAPAGYAFNYWQYGTGVDIDCPTLYCQSTVMTVQASGNFWIAAYFYPVTISVPSFTVPAVTAGTVPAISDGSYMTGAATFHLNETTANTPVLLLDRRCD